MAKSSLKELIKNMHKPKNKHDTFLDEYETLCRMHGLFIHTDRFGNSFIATDGYCDGYDTSTITVNISKIKSNYQEENLTSIVDKDPFEED